MALRQVGDGRPTEWGDRARPSRLFALAHLAAADTFMTVWDSKPADQQLGGFSAEEIASLRAAVS
jgi:hypothetical protein